METLKDRATPSGSLLWFWIPAGLMSTYQVFQWMGLIISSQFAFEAVVVGQQCIDDLTVNDSQG